MNLSIIMCSSSFFHVSVLSGFLGFIFGSPFCVVFNIKKGDLWLFPFSVEG